MEKEPNSHKIGGAKLSPKSPAKAVKLNEKKEISKDDMRHDAALKAWHTRREKGWVSKPRKPKRPLPSIEVSEKPRKKIPKQKSSDISSVFNAASAKKFGLDLAESQKRHTGSP